MYVTAVHGNSRKCNVHFESSKLTAEFNYYHIQKGKIFEYISYLISSDKLKYAINFTCKSWRQIEFTA